MAFLVMSSEFLTANGGFWVGLTLTSPNFYVKMFRLIFQLNY